MEIGKKYTKDKIWEFKKEIGSREYAFGVDAEGNKWYIRFENYEFRAQSYNTEYTCTKTPTESLEIIPEGPAVHRPSRKSSASYYQRSKGGAKEKFNPITPTGGKT